VSHFSFLEPAPGLRYRAALLDPIRQLDLASAAAAAATAATARSAATACGAIRGRRHPLHGALDRELVLPRSKGCQRCESQ
jgi:hypothetical protein